MGEIGEFVAVLYKHIPAIFVTNNPDTLRDYTVDGVLPRLVVTPTTVDEIAQTVSLAHQYGLTLLARGNGAYMHIGGLSERIDVLLETNQLTRLLEHEAPDLTCHVEAGITLAALQAQLMTKGQRLALDPPNAEQATLGGLLAANASGPKRLRY